MNDKTLEYYQRLYNAYEDISNNDTKARALVHHKKRKNGWYYAKGESIKSECKNTSCVN